MNPEKFIFESNSLLSGRLDPKQKKHIEGPLVNAIKNVEKAVKPKLERGLLHQMEVKEQTYRIYKAGGASAPIPGGYPQPYGYPQYPVYGQQAIPYPPYPGMLYPGQQYVYPPNYPMYQQGYPDGLHTETTVNAQDAPVTAPEKGSK